MNNIEYTLQFFLSIKQFNFTHIRQRIKQRVFRKNYQLNFPSNRYHLSAISLCVDIISEAMEILFILLFYLFRSLFFQKQYVLKEKKTILFSKYKCRHCLHSMMSHTLCHHIGFETFLYQNHFH